MKSNEDVLDEKIAPSSSKKLLKTGILLESLGVGSITVALIIKYFHGPYYPVLLYGCIGAAFIYLLFSWIIFPKGSTNILKIILSILTGIALAWFCMDILILDKGIKGYSGLIHWGSKYMIGVIILNVIAYFTVREQYSLNSFSWNIVTKLIFALIMQEFLKMGLIFS